MGPDSPAAPHQTTPAVPEAPPSLLKRLWRGWIKPVGLAVLVVMTLRSAVADWNDVPTQSMEPSILVGDRIVVNKIAYDLKIPFTTQQAMRWGDPERGDVVIFFAPPNGKRMVKRVVGLPGDVIELRHGQLLVNGEPQGQTAPATDGIDPRELTDPAPFAFFLEHLGLKTHTVMAQPGKRVERSFGPITVPEGHYFMLGDNRDNSGDSRIFGCVPREEIVGKVVGLAFSLDQNHGYAPRWKRFFRGL
jgi:signal peptidase I